MVKKTNRGFVLMETLIVSCFVMALFGMLYTTVFPLLGRYEGRKHYDDLDSKYIANWVRKMILNDGNYGKFKNILNDGNGTRIVDFTNCSGYVNNTLSCIMLRDLANIKKMYLTTYSIADRKYALISQYDGDRKDDFTHYIEYLPNYNTTSAKQDFYRLIVVVEHDNYDTYATIEVIF